MYPDGALNTDRRHDVDIDSRHRAPDRQVAQYVRQALRATIKLTRPQKRIDTMPDKPKLSASM